MMGITSRDYGDEQNLDLVPDLLVKDDQDIDDGAEDIDDGGE
jgi:hypothetical protein